MKHENGALVERDPDSVEPVGWHMLVEYVERKREGVIVAPDTAGKGDMKSREGFFGKVIKLSPKFKKDEYRTGDILVFDESNNPFDKTRAFRWNGKQYVLCNIDTDVILAKVEPNDA